MQAKRQNIQLEPALEPEAKGEARRPGPRGTEVCVARAGPERPAAGRGPSMEAVVDPGNLKKALARVRRNKGAPGIDGMTVKELGGYLKEHWPETRFRLLDGTYEPQPVRRVEIPKASGGVRLLGVPTVHRTVEDPGEHDDRGLRVELERQRQEQSEARERLEPGKHPDDRAPEHPDHAVEEVRWAEGRLEDLREVAERLHVGSACPRSACSRPGQREIGWSTALRLRVMRELVDCPVCLHLMHPRRSARPTPGDGKRGGHHEAAAAAAAGLYVAVNLAQSIDRHGQIDALLAGVESAQIDVDEHPLTTLVVRIVPQFVQTAGRLNLKILAFAVHFDGFLVSA